MGRASITFWFCAATRTSTKLFTIIVFVWGCTTFTFAQYDFKPTDSYARPPKVIVDLLDSAQTPKIVVSPAHDTIALTEQPNMPRLQTLASPMLRLAGFRINPRSKTRWQAPQISQITLVEIETGATHKIVAPLGTTLGWVTYSPNGRYISYSIIRDTGAELWVAETTSGRPRAVTSASLNATQGNPCQWLPDSNGVICRFLPSARGAPPDQPQIPYGPNVQTHEGDPAPVRTHKDLLASDYDEALFSYHFSSQLGAVRLETGRRTDIGEPGLFEKVELAPNGQHLLVVRWQQPFSRLVPANQFPKSVEVWKLDRAGISQLAELPLADTVPIGGVPSGPRGHRWDRSKPATVVWIEALDGGNPRIQVGHRDRVRSLAAPFLNPPTDIIRTGFRFWNISWTSSGVALIEERDRPTRWTRTWIYYSETGETRRLWDRSTEDRYQEPGSPVPWPGGGQNSFVIGQKDNSILLSGHGASENGEQPFVDRLNLTSLETERLFQADDISYETLVAPLTVDGSVLLTQRESKTKPPNYFVRDLTSDQIRSLTNYNDPVPLFHQVEKRRISYTRADGVGLSATLYLPPGHQDGKRIPMLIWAYPRELTSATAASQVSGSVNRFTMLRGASHLALLTQGYAILDGPTMPIIKPGETANNNYINQLVLSASAAVNTVVKMGIAHRDRIAIGGHSYGAFMAATLLAHSDLFKAGIAWSGAYNRTLTPFGFQNERRTFWEQPDIYSEMSPLFHAHQVNEPVLLIHGEADNNSDTFPIQSKHFYMALRGHGTTVRYVTLPHESHVYAARESILHVISEMLNWCNQYIGEGTLK